MKIIYIEGNIAAGKTTLLNKLGDLGYDVIPEPVQEWKRALAIFYAEPTPTHAMALQTTILTSIYLNIFEKIKTAKDNVLIFERSLDSVELFTTHLFNQGKLTQNQAQLVQNLVKIFKADVSGMNIQEEHILLDVDVPIFEGTPCKVKFCPDES